MIFQQILPLALLTISNGVKSTNSKSIEQSGEHTFTWNWENEWPATLPNVKYDDTINILCPKKLGLGVKSFSIYRIDTTNRPVFYENNGQSVCTFYKNNRSGYTWEFLNTCNQDKNNINENPDVYALKVEQPVFPGLLSWTAKRNYTIIADLNDNTLNKLYNEKINDIDRTGDPLLEEDFVYTSKLCWKYKQGLSFYVEQKHEGNPTNPVTVGNAVKPDSSDYVDQNSEEYDSDYDSRFGDDESGQSSSNLNDGSEPENFKEIWATTSLTFKLLALTGIISICSCILLIVYCIFRKKIISKNPHNRSERHPSSRDGGHIYPTMGYETNQTSNSSNNEIDNNYTFFRNHVKNPVKAEVPKFVSKEDLRLLTGNKVGNLAAYNQNQNNNTQNQTHKSILNQNDSAATSVSSRKNTKLTASQEILANFSTNSPSPVVPLDADPGPRGRSEFVRGYNTVTEF